MNKPTKAELESVSAYDAGCNELLKRFSSKYEFDECNCYWVADNAGDIACVGDYFFSCEAMKVALKANLSWSELMEWYDYTIDSEAFHLITPNLESWVKGCPRASAEQLNVLRSLSENHLLKSPF